MSVSFLRRTAAYGAVFTATGCFIMYYKIQSNFAAGQYYKLSVDALRADERVVKSLGPPVKTLFLNLGDKRNFVVADKAQLSIPIRGSKYKGLLHTRCHKEDEKWKIISLEVEVNDKTVPVNFQNNLILIDESENLG